MSKLRIALAAMSLLVIINSLIGGPYIGLSTTAFCLMCLGIMYRDTPTIHQKLMLSAIGLDILIVLALEVTRGAVETSLFKSLNWTQYFHISASLIAVLIYFAQITFGFRLRKKTEAPLQLRQIHKNLGLACFFFRSIGFVFMYSMISK